MTSNNHYYEVNYDIFLKVSFFIGQFLPNFPIASHLSVKESVCTFLDAYRTILKYTQYFF